MRLGVTQWTLDVKGVATVARAAELGFSALQLDAGNWSGWPEVLDKKVQQAYLETSQESGVELAGIGVNAVNELSLTVDQPEARVAVIRAVDTASAMRIPLVYVPAFNASEIKTDEHLKTTASILGEISAYAAERAITLASENTLDAARQLKLLDMANHPNLNLFIDTQNPALWGHDVAALLEPLKPYLCDQIHAKDGRGGVMGNAPLGEGEAQFERTAQEIKRLKLNPLLISENEYGEDAERLAAKDIATLEHFFS